MKKLLIGLFVIFLVFGCDSSNKKLKYKILNESKLTKIKYSIDLEVKKELSKYQIKKLFTDIKEKNSGYERYFVNIYLPNMEVGSGAWATANYDKYLKINKIGKQIKRRKLENNKYFKKLILKSVISWLRYSGKIVRIDEEIFDKNTIVFDNYQSSEKTLTYNVKLPVTFTKDDGFRVDAYIESKISILENEPKTKFKYSYKISKKNEYWFNYFKEMKLIRRNFNKDRSINKLKKQIVRNGFLGTPEVISILKKYPLHIKVSEWAFKTSLSETIIENNERAIVYVALMTFIFSDFNEVKITGIPLRIKSIKPNNIKKGRFLNKYKKTIFIKRNDMLSFLKTKFKMNSFYDLIYQNDDLKKGTLKKQINTLLYNDQGGFTLNKFYRFLSKK